jgi:nitrite reductase (NO-forming)
VSTIPGEEPPQLSEIVQTPFSRRSFLARSAAAGAVVAAACQQPQQQRSGAPGDTVSARPINSNSRADTLLLDPEQMRHRTTAPAEQAAPYRRYDPALPPLSEERSVRLHWRSRELPVRIAPDLVVAGWTFEGDIPGPIVHVRAGDTIEFTLTNEGDVPHSMDFHAAQLDPKTAFRSVPRGESITFTFRPRYPGAYMYHCGTAPVLMHIGTGMYGAIIVSPREALPQAREFVLVHSEYYVSPAENGIAAFDYSRMMSTLPDYVVFNGRPDQYVREPLRVKQGDRVRFYVVSAGPTHPCAFHVVGEQFEKVYLGAPPRNFIEGVQTYAVPAGGGMIFEFVADVAGEFPFVNHGFGHGQKGAIGFLVVEP